MARSPSPPDARVPCSQCGGLIHPIAGRCKHCKTDLAALRSSRPAAAASLPSLGVRQPVPGAVPSPGATATPLAMPFEDSQPILPPRPDASLRMRSQDQGPAWWKSWPMIVIVLASLAIVAAILLLVLPKTAKDKRLVDPPGPAPDRMNTNPMSPKSDPGTQPQTPPDKDKDPWGQQGKVDPRKRPPPPDPIPSTPPDDPDDMDPGGVIGGLGGLGGGYTGMMSAMVKHGCDRLTSCGTDPGVKMVCDGLSQSLGRMRTSVPSCPAAARCLAQIDQLDCDIKVDDFGSIITLQSKFLDCAEAMSC